jgi:hypothetical protein
MITNVKRQHYVWEHYLKAWSVDDKIWCKRNEKIFNTSTENVAQIRYYYESKPLNRFEIDFIHSLISKLHPTAHSSLRENLDFYIFVSQGDVFLRRNGIEKLHSIFEGRSLEIFNAIRDGDIGILNDDSNKIEFCKFLGRQYTRTKKMRNSKIELPKNIPVPDHLVGRCDFQKVYDVFTFLLSENVGNWAYSDGIFNLLQTQENLYLITCDQPINNLDANYNGLSESFRLYYPLSPKKALIISKELIEEKMLTFEEVAKLNNHMKKISYESIFAHQKELLL